MYRLGLIVSIFALLSCSFGYQIFSSQIKEGNRTLAVRVAKVTPKTFWLLPRVRIIYSSAACVNVYTQDNIYLKMKLRYWSDKELKFAEKFVDKMDVSGSTVQVPSVSGITVSGMDNLGYALSKKPLHYVNIGQLQQTQEIWIPLTPRSRARVAKERCRNFIYYLKKRELSYEGANVKFQFDPRGLPNYSPESMNVKFSTSEIASVASYLSTSKYKWSALISPSRFSFYATERNLARMAVRLSELKIKFLRKIDQAVPYSGDVATFAADVLKKLRMEPRYYSSGVDMIGGRSYKGEIIYKIQFRPITVITTVGVPMRFLDVGFE